MDKPSTKEEILNVAMDLFSQKGFEATSMSMIADAVGVRKASLYSHFKSKQAILDELVNMVLVNYSRHSIFAREDLPLIDYDKDVIEEISTMIKGQIRYIIHDPNVAKGRKMCVIEQFQNKELSMIQTKHNYQDIMDYFERLIKELIDKKILIDDDVTIMAAEFSLPITVWINCCDREPEREEEFMDLVERHIRQFFRMYKKER